MAVGVAPVFGPVVGGYLAEAYSWRWSFYMLVPVGLVALAALRMTLPPDRKPTQTQLDWTGFLALSVAMGSLQLVLARGVRLDWYQSTEIIIETAVAALPFVLKAPDGPDCELRRFGESSVDFAVEYWVNGIDDGKNKYGSQVLFAVWRTLKAEGIEMPYPHRVVELRGAAK